MNLTNNLLTLGNNVHKNFLIWRITYLGLGVSRTYFIREYSSDHFKDYIDYNFPDVKHLTGNDDITNNHISNIPTNNYKRVSLSLFLINDINLNITPNYFRKEFKKNYPHLKKVLQDDRIVSVIFKVKFCDGSYRNLGSQFGFKFNFNEFNTWNFAKSPYIKIFLKYYYEIYKSSVGLKKPFLNESFDYTFSTHNTPLNLDQFYSRYVGYLMDYMEEYYDIPVDCFVIIFISLPENVDHKKSVKNVNSIPFKRNISNIKNIRKAFKSSLLPFTLEENSYGKRYYSTSTSETTTHFLSRSRTFIDSINKVKRVVTDISPNKTKKDIFSLDLGKHLETFIDEKLDEESFTRHNPRNKTSITIRKDKITRTSSFIKLPLIKFTPPKHSNNTFNKHIGSFDLETYYNTITGKNEVYSVGFSYGGGNVFINTPFVKTYYLEPYQNSSDIVLACINDMLVTKYHNGIFYTHNLGGYDVVFILKILGDYNKKVGEKYYKMDVILRDNRILKLKISVKKSKSVTNTIFLVDSLGLLPMSLASLAESFRTPYKKTLFPYTFVTEKTLNYIGNTPAIEYYHTGKKDVSLEEYLKVKKTHWDLKQETIKYLESDLISLLQIMYEFSQYIFDSHRIQVTECLTITSIAVKIFLSNHYHEKGKHLPLIKNRVIYEDIKQAYYGGLSEVYRGYGENLYYYDVNSLYPYAALEDTIGNLCTYIETYTEEDSLDIQKDKLFGFFYCDVKTNKHDYFGLLPYRHLGLLTYPLGEFSGWFFSSQIEFAQKNGYEIKIRKGYKFNKISNVFDDYVKTIYKEKNENFGGKRLIAKLLLNALLGRFGMHIDKKITSLIDNDETYMNIISRYPVYDDKVISEELYLLSHGAEISKNVCEQHGINYIDVLNDSKGGSSIQEEFNTVRNVSVGVSASITAYSSIFMLKIKKYIQSLGGQIYYTDTDSIVTNIPLPEEYIGNDIGQFKLEYKIIRGYFISSKLYCLVVWDKEKNKEKVVIKAKGVYGSRLTEKDFITLLNNEEITHGVKGYSKKNYSEGYVSINTKNDIKLNPNNYRKRIKILDPITKKWTDTRPLFVGCDLPEDSK